MEPKQFSSPLCRGGQLIVFVAALTAANAASAARPDRCADLIKKFGDRLTDIVCFESPDLTTKNPATTPANNSLPGLPVLAFTPVGDREVLSQSKSGDTPIAGPVPGIQLQARIADDPLGQARFLLRVPDNWNGDLVVAGAAATRSEFNGDFAWSDYVVQKGYAYASQNKGTFNAKLTDPKVDPLACRANPDAPFWVNYYVLGKDQSFERWDDYIIKAAELARWGLAYRHGHAPQHTYAVGASNGGYQVRRAIESAPHLFDGGVDWEGTFVDPVGPNLLTDLPPAVLNYADYVASGYNPNSTAAKNILAAGYPPDIVIGSGPTAVTLWKQNWTSYWEVSWCQWQKRLDPTYDTYVSGIDNYTYTARLSVSDVGSNAAAIATTGEIKRPLITVAGTMDALLPIDRHARAYARKVTSFFADTPGKSTARQDQPAYRLYEVQNGNHIEAYKTTFPQLELIGPHARHAFDLLVEHVEHGKTLPPDQCVPRGQAIEDVPAQNGHCQQLFVP